MENRYDDLARSAASGDRASFVELYEHTYLDVYYSAFKYTNSFEGADYITREAYRFAWKNIKSDDAAGDFKKWISAIAAGTARNALTNRNPGLFKQTNEENYYINEPFCLPDENPVIQPEMNYNQNEIVSLVNTLLGGQPDEQRLCFMMFYEEKFSVEQIAEVLNISPLHVQLTLNSSRNILADKAAELDRRGYSFFGFGIIAFVMLLIDKEKAIPALIDAANASKANNSNRLFGEGVGAAFDDSYEATVKTPRNINGRPAYTDSSAGDGSQSVGAYNERSGRPAYGNGENAYGNQPTGAYNERISRPAYDDEATVYTNQRAGAYNERVGRPAYGNGGNAYGNQPAGAYNERGSRPAYDDEATVYTNQRAGAYNERSGRPAYGNGENAYGNQPADAYNEPTEGKGYRSSGGYGNLYEDDDYDKTIRPSHSKGKNNRKKKHDNAAGKAAGANVGGGNSEDYSISIEDAYDVSVRKENYYADENTERGNYGRSALQNAYEEADRDSAGNNKGGSNKKAKNKGNNKAKNKSGSKKSSKTKMIILIAAAVVIAACVGAGIYFFPQIKEFAQEKFGLFAEDNNESQGENGFASENIADAPETGKYSLLDEDYEQFVNLSKDEFEYALAFVTLKPDALEGDYSEQKVYTFLNTLVQNQAGLGTSLSLTASVGNEFTYNMDDINRYFAVFSDFRFEPNQSCMYYSTDDYLITLAAAASISCDAEADIISAEIEDGVMTVRYNYTLHKWGDGEDENGIMIATLKKTAGGQYVIGKNERY